MADFLLNPGANPGLALTRATAFLRFHPGIAHQILSFSHFTLLLSSGENQTLWAPCDTGGLFVAVVGRIALDEPEWRTAERLSSPGGLAARWVADQYRQHGGDAFSSLNGNFALILFDRRAEKLFIVTDPVGAFPVFRSTLPGSPAFGSHPDALAMAVGEDQHWDETSLAEFALSGIVTPPHTYYRHIEAVSHGQVVEISFAGGLAITQRSHFQFAFQPRSSDTEDTLAQELAETFKMAVQRRASPRFGVTALALSGGLDSRAILAAAHDRSHLFAFCCFDQENYEFNIARRIARAANVKLVPIPRPFDFYADNAELGMRISGGMGSFANNHFLGLAPQLRELGVENLLTGCYCDYLFKGLVLNRRTTGLLQREHLAPFQEQYYFGHYRLQPHILKNVRERWLARFPESLRQCQDDAAAFEIEQLRTFPLWHEGDNAQRLVPQRVLHSYLPFADRDLLKLYCRIPYRFKLNRSLFKKAAARVCGPALTQIPDANTGAPVDATLLQEAISGTILKVKSKMPRFRRSLATQASWPDWHYYVPNSPRLRQLWQEETPAGADFFQRVLLPADIRKSPTDYRGADLFQFVQLLTLKLWFKQRCSSEF